MSEFDWNLDASEQAVVRSLLEHGVQFVVVGGHAALAHGRGEIYGDGEGPADLDVLVEAAEENWDRLGNAIAALPDGSSRFPGLPANRTQFMVGWYGVHVLVEPDRDFSVLLSRSAERLTSGLRVRVVGWDDWVDLKRASGREKDILHLQRLGIV